MWGTSLRMATTVGARQVVRMFLISPKDGSISLLSSIFLESENIPKMTPYLKPVPYMFQPVDPSLLGESIRNKLRGCFSWGGMRALPPPHGWYPWDDTLRNQQPHIQLILWVFIGSQSPFKGLQQGSSTAYRVPPFSL